MRFVVLLVLFGWVAPSARAQTVLTFDGEVPADPATHFFVPFAVPAGTVEIEVRHDDQSAENILDFGLEDSAGFRGWGGGNVEPAVVGIDRASRSYVPGPIGTGTWRVVIGKAKVVSFPATYHLEIELRTVGTLAPQPERTPYVASAPLRTGWAWYAGDFHVHSRESGDASPTLDGIADVATGRGLDFVAISDHNTHTALDFFVDAQSRHPSMLFVPSVEFTTYAGHANAIGATSWVDHRIGVEGATIADSVAAYHAQGAFFSLNHPSLALGDLCIGCAWNQPLATDAIDGIELQTTGQAIVTLSFLAQNVARWDTYCDEGRHVVPLGGSDDHRGGEGTGTLDSPIGDPTTFVLAPELSVAGILAGLRSGRTFVGIAGPESPRVVLGSSDLDEGSDTIHARSTRLTIDVTGGEGQSLDVFKNGVRTGDSIYVDADPFHGELKLRAPAAGEDRYRVEATDAAGTTTITGHVYLTRIGAPPSDGCSTVEGAATPIAALVALALVGAIRRGRRARNDR